MNEVVLEPAEPRLAHFPITFFAAVMGLLGFAIALHAAENAFDLGHMASHATRILAVAVFCAITAVYAAKMLTHPAAVSAEWQHPVRAAFFPTFSISLLLMSIAFLEAAPATARWLWIGGASLQAVLTFSVLAAWIGHRPYQHAHLSPAWFIPVVGNVIAPIAGAALGFIELSWFYFSMGLVFWLVLLTLVMNRLIFHDPLPGRLQPTLVILIAPPAVACVAYARLTGEIDTFARILLNTGYVFALIVLTQAPRIARLPFALSWWALSFPLAALTIATFVFADATGSAFHLWLAVALLALLAVIVTGLLLRTLAAIAGHEICLPE